MTALSVAMVPAAMPPPAGVMSFEGSLVAWATVGVSCGIAVILLFRMRGAVLASEVPQNNAGEGRHSGMFIL